MKNDAVSETPKKRRTRAASEAPAADTSAADATSAGDPATPARRTTRRRTTKAAEATEAVETTETKSSEPKSSEPKSSEPKAEAPKRRTTRGRKEAAEPETKAAEKKAEKIEKTDKPAAKAEPKAAHHEVAPVVAATTTAAVASATVASEAPAPAAAEAGRQQGGRQGRQERQRHGRGGGGGGGGQPQGEQPQPNQGDQQSRRSRRRRRRGRGGGQATGQLPPGLEAQLQPVQGVLEIDDRGNGRLRRMEKMFTAPEADPEVPKNIIERYRLRPGAFLDASALVRNNKPVIHRVDKVEGVSPDEASDRLAFPSLTSVDPDRRVILETNSGELLTRAIDIIAPIGFGQRALIVAPPKTGKTIILQKIAKAVLTNHPSAKLMVLLIDERPEEVTDFKRTINSEVYGSSSDRPAHEHLRLAELVLERARRLVEAGEDVVILLDSITRLARAFNKEIESSGRTMSGGVDSKALERPKRIFGAARNTEEAGSLTIIATALIDTGSRMDEVIFEEFKGTGNMEIVLDRQLAERRIFPAISPNNSGTRKEEKLFSVKENEKIRKLRAYLASMRPADAMEKLLARLRDFRSNAEFFEAV